jgi:DNA damage-binding protein 1
MRIENSNIQPKLLFCTVNGAIGTISELTSEYYEILSTLQTHMQSQQGVGGLKHDDFRQFKTVSQSKPMSMSIDGDFVETFVDMPSDVQQQIANDMNTQLSDILNVIEECMRIH